jgi:hypothetical protein
MSDGVSLHLERPALRAAMVRFDTLSPSRWAAGFERLASMGFDAVDLPLVWSAHQPTPAAGSFEQGSLAVIDAIRAARAAGLRTRVRLGPRCVEGEDGFGVPAWVLRDPRCAARSARRGPVLEMIGLTPTPVPSLVSSAYRAACGTWIESAIRAIGPELHAIDAVVVGPGTFAPARADAVELDSHPDEPACPMEPEARSLEAERRTARFVTELLALAEREGVPAAKLRASVAGTASGALGLSLAERWPVDLAVPFATAGTDAIWDASRAALALARRGASLDVLCGTSPFMRPIRNRDAAAAALVVLAAGVPEITVRGAWIGHGWIGSLLDESGAERPAARRWRSLFDAAASLPIDRAVVVTEHAPVSSSPLAPLSRGWISQHGLLSVPRGGDDPSPYGLRCDPENAVRLRRDGDRLVVLSRSEHDATLFDPASRWLEADALVVRAGEAVTLVARGGDAS